MARYILDEAGKPQPLDLSFGKGEHHRASDTRIPAGYARFIINYNVDDDELTTRYGAGDPVCTGGHSMHTTPDGRTYYVADGVLSQFRGETVFPVLDTFGNRVYLSSKARVWWVDVAGKTYYSNGRITGIIDAAGRARPWGIPNPTIPRELPDAKESRIVTWVDDTGEESGGVRYDGPLGLLSNPGYAARLYPASAKGELYRAASGLVIQTMGMQPFPAAKYLTSYSGCIYGALGRFVVHTVPMRYGLYDPGYNFIDLGSEITALCAVSDGLYACTETDVWWLSALGQDAQMTAERVHGAGAFPGSQFHIDLQETSVDALQINSLAQTRGQAVGWLSPWGAVFGLPGGVVKTPQADAAAIPAPGVSDASIITRDGFVQLVVVVDSIAQEAPGIAAAVL